VTGVQTCALPILIQILLFVTPVIYPVSILKYDWLKMLVALNPMYAALALFRLPMSNAAPDVSLLAISMASGVVFLAIGIYYFRITERYFADLS
jgi:lipopolysaccharide transport system permease protein